MAIKNSVPVSSHMGPSFYPNIGLNCILFLVCCIFLFLLANSIIQQVLLFDSFFNAKQLCNFLLKQTCIIVVLLFFAPAKSTGKSYSIIKEGYKASKVKSHLIFYDLDSKNNIHIFRILHQRMDVEQKIKKE